MALTYSSKETEKLFGSWLKNVLLVGNEVSTYWNSTEWAGEIAKSIDVVPPMEVEVSTLSGVAGLRSHLSDINGSKGLMAIRKGGWKVVVLQESPYEPLMRQDSFFSAVTRLAAEARQVGAEVVLFEPFGLAPGSVVFGPRESWSGGDARAMQERLRAICGQIADRLHIRMARLGDAFEWVSIHNPEIDLYENDKIHPSPCGAFLEACVLASLLSNGDPRASHWLPKTGVSEAQAAILRAAAWTAGFSS